MSLDRRPGGRKANLTHRLREIAKELEPARGPFHVSQPAGKTPAPGWWWIPQGLAAPVYLGHNHIIAETQLRQILEGQEKPA